MRVEFLTRSARVTLLVLAQAALERLIAVRHGHGWSRSSRAPGEP
jgi:hypothetical protein